MSLFLSCCAQESPVDLVEEPLALARPHRRRPGEDHAQAAAGDVLEPVVEAVEAAAVHEEGAVGKLRPVRVAEELRIEPQREAEAPRDEVVGAERVLDRLEHLVEDRSRGLGDAGVDVGVQPRRPRGEGRVVHAPGPALAPRLGVEAGDEEIHDRAGERKLLLRGGLDALAGVRVGIDRAQDLMDEVAEGEDRLRLIELELRMRRGHRLRRLVHPLDAGHLVAHLPPELAARIDRRAVRGLDDEGDDRHGAVRRILHDVEVRATDRDVVAGEDPREPLQHGARARVLDRDGEAGDGRIALRLELDHRRLRAGHAAEERVVLADAKRREREHVVGGAVGEVGGDAFGAPVRGVGLCVRDGLGELLLLPRIARIEGLLLAELEGVEDELSVLRGVDLRGPQREVERQARDEIGEDARPIRGTHERPLPVVLAPQRHLEGTTARAGRDDRLQMAHLRRAIGVLEVHRGHLAEEPGHHRVRGVAEAPGKVVDDGGNVERGVGHGRRAHRV
jgi:hypothetical protein